MPLIRGKKSHRSSYSIFKISIGLILILLVSLLMVKVFFTEEAKEEVSSAENIAGALSEDIKELLPAGTSFKKSESGEIIYFELSSDKGEKAGYIFQTKDFAPDVLGYGGRIKILARTDKSGILEDFIILEHYETPGYLNSVLDEKDVFLNKNIFTGQGESALDAVSGATISSNAISEILRRSGRGFYSKVLKGQLEPIIVPEAKSKTSYLPIILLVLFACAFFIRYKISWAVRACFLLLVVILTGFVFNMQFSFDSIIPLLKLDLPLPALTLGFFFTIVLPILIFLFGNIYCGYLCPFGALQELIGFFRPKKLEGIPSLKFSNIAKNFKYFVLFIYATGFLISLDVSINSGDLLSGFFGKGFSSRGVLFRVLAGLVLLMSFFSNRFWCRYLCPSGAFLSLINGIKIFNRKIKSIILKPGKCDLGIIRMNEFDCINCDRCRLRDDHNTATHQKFFSKSNIIFLFFLIVCFVIMLLLSFSSILSSKGKSTPEKKQAAITHCLKISKGSNS